MVKRRSLDDALTPEEEEFLKKGSSGKKSDLEEEPTPDPKPQPEKKEETPMARLSPLKESFIQEAPPAAAKKPGAEPPSAGTGAINARIDPKITTALLRASVERRIEGITPWTQREIIAEALTDWLRKNGNGG